MIPQQVSLWIAVAASCFNFISHGVRLRKTHPASIAEELLNLQAVVRAEEGSGSNHSALPWVNKDDKTDVSSAVQHESNRAESNRSSERNFPWAQSVPAAASAPGQQSAPSQGSYAQPKVFFLFLAVDKVSNLGIWTKFFQAAPSNQYRALVHCKLPECNSMVQGSPLIPVPTVPSYYCTDLVSPMNQLIAVALGMDGGQGNPADKFAFLSDSSLPAKPFSLVYSTLVARQGSDFCVFPSNEWADVAGATGLEIAAKSHQWVTLNRAHAEKASYLWAGGQMHDFMSRFRMNMHAYTWNNNTFADQRNFGCLDEFWYMVALFGTLTTADARRESIVHLPQFSGSPLQIGAGAGWQGACDTFVMWSKYLNAPGNNPFQRFHASLDPPSVPHGGNDQRPGWWDTMSTTGMRAIRSSEFLFMRKFIDNPALSGGGSFADAYAQLVFA